MERVMNQDRAVNMQRFATNIREESIQSPEATNNFVNAMKDLSGLQNLAESTYPPELKRFGELKSLEDLKKLADPAKETTITVNVKQPHSLDRRHKQDIAPQCLYAPWHPLCWIGNDWWKRDLAATQARDMKSIDPGCVLNSSTSACRMGTVAEEPVVEEMSSLARREVQTHAVTKAQNKWTPWCLIKIWMPRCYGMKPDMPKDSEKKSTSRQDLTGTVLDKVGPRDVKSVDNKEFCFPWCVHPDWEDRYLAAQTVHGMSNSLSRRGTQAKQVTWKGFWKDVACVFEAFQGPHCDGA
jgi:hypothetical protein